MNIKQQSDRAVIDWRSFSIRSHEHVDFQQPSSSAAALNRVTGPQVSDIQGRLTANGQVFLANPNGIIFGESARVDVGGLVATTHDIANEDFMAGHLRFANPNEGLSGEPKETSARVINHGQISAADAGLVAFVAPGVENTGVIQAKLGHVYLASGEAFTLDLYGDGLVGLKVDEPVLKQVVTPEGEPVSTLVDQRGEIRADGGTVVLSAHTAKQTVDNVINMKGVIRAQTVAEQNGQIVLFGGEDAGTVRVAGQLDARGTEPGETGGEVQVLGHEVALAEAARIDASGDAGGGKVLVGGDFRGEGAVPTAARTSVAEGSEIAADALSSGDGGRVIVRADEAMAFHGTITARGGSTSGDGGFAEVSGKKALEFDGEVALDAPRGALGTLLLDPENLTVGETGSSTLEGDPPTIQAAVVSRTLGDGTNVALAATNDITVAAPIDARYPGAKPGASLALDAGRDVNLQADIFTQNGAIDITAETGSITMSAQVTRSDSGASGPAFLFAGDQPVTLQAAQAIDVQHIVTTGPVTLTATEGPVRLHEDLGGSEGFPLGAFTATATQGEVLLRGLQTTAATTVSAGQRIAVNGPIDSGGPVMLQGVDGAPTAIDLNHNIYTEGDDITFRGDVLINPTAEELENPVNIADRPWQEFLGGACQLPTCTYVCAECPRQLCRDCEPGEPIPLTMDQFLRYVLDSFDDPDGNLLVAGLDADNDTPADADRRAEALLKLFEAMEITISTGDDSGGNVVFAGDVRREAAEALATAERVFDEDGNRRPEFEGVVFPTFVHQGLVVSGGLGEVTFEGDVGDSKSFDISLLGTTGRILGFPGDVMANFPVLGTFYVAIPSASQVSFPPGKVFVNDASFRGRYVLKRDPASGALTTPIEFVEGVSGSVGDFFYKFPNYSFTVPAGDLISPPLGPTAAYSQSGGTVTGISGPSLPSASSSPPTIIQVPGPPSSPPTIIQVPRPPSPLVAEPPVLPLPDATKEANRLPTSDQAPAKVSPRWHLVQVLDADAYRGNPYFLLDPFAWARKVATRAGEEEEEEEEERGQESR